MIGEFDMDDRIQNLVDRIVDSYVEEPATRHISRGYLPSRAEIEKIIGMLFEISYPGYFDRQNLSFKNVKYHVGELLPRLGQSVYMQVFLALCHLNEVEGHYDPNGPSSQALPFDAKAREITHAFLDEIPAMRNKLALDVKAAFDGDPACENTDEVIVAYPGLLAITVYRYAHKLYEMDVPLIPRAMAEWAHMRTGIDIHPGARIGERFFIDHGTGVVIGETTDIGENVKVYQSVTLGALSFLKDDRGRMVRGYKRHPTVSNDVTIYANATILGGDTLLGEGATVGGSTFLTSSVPAGSTVICTPPELKVRPPKQKTGPAHDFSI
ncbi:MAG TPA: serine acetyltransferase [Phycisphaerae bacterium]|nr:serine acetyltransferase [Phycisphaerae bacterium]